MNSRDRLIDLFSTFARLEEDRFRQWIADPRLLRSMQRLLADGKAEANEQVWARYWHQLWAKHPLAVSHLTAYLQEPCFWAAREMTQRLKAADYTLADYFQIANGEIQRVLKSFTADRGSSLKTYAKLVLTSAIKDLLRQRQAANVCSDWSLLRKVSKKRIGEMLVHRGVAEPEACQYQFAWFCFKTLYIPPDSNGQQLPPPTVGVWQEIVELYNSKRQDQLFVPGVALTAAQMEGRLTKLAQWTRAYLYPSIDSLNRSKPEAGTGEIQDDLTDARNESLLDAAIEREEIQERVSQQSQLQAILTQALGNLSLEHQEILELVYREALSQQELADRLQISQSTISRRIKKAEAQLLEALLTWIESRLHKFPDPSELKIITSTLKEWITEYFQ